MEIDKADIAIINVRHFSTSVVMRRNKVSMEIYLKVKVYGLGF